MPIHDPPTPASTSTKESSDSWPRWRAFFRWFAFPVFLTAISTAFFGSGRPNVVLFADLKAEVMPSRVSSHVDLPPQFAEEPRMVVMIFVKNAGDAPAEDVQIPLEGDYACEVFRTWNSPDVKSSSIEDARDLITIRYMNKDDIVTIKAWPKDINRQGLLDKLPTVPNKIHFRGGGRTLTPMGLSTWGVGIGIMIVWTWLNFEFNTRLHLVE